MTGFTFHQDLVKKLAPKRVLDSRNIKKMKKFLKNIQNVILRVWINKNCLADVFANFPEQCAVNSR